MSTISPIAYKRHHYPEAIVSQRVRLYSRFDLRFRDVELMMAQLGGSSEIIHAC
jgi:transposase-like protein